MSGQDPRAALAALEQRARKRFGQHFLTDRSIVDRIVRGARVVAGDRVVEIGPGLGILTSGLVDAGAEVTAVELDRDLIGHLRETLPSVRLIEGDAAKVDWSATCPGAGWKVVSNLPYNVGTTVVMQLLRTSGTFTSVTVMLQLEVVQRLCAEPGSKTYGALTVEAAVRATPTFLFKVGPERFHPRPKVDSAVLRLDLLPEPDTGGVPPGRFDEVVKAAFSQRRKTLLNALSARYGRERSGAALEAAGIATELRAERLDPEGFRRLARALVDGPR